jgi:hypothetical protein
MIFARTDRIVRVAILSVAVTTLLIAYSMRSSATDEIETITFTGGVPGDYLYVTQVCATSHGGTPQLGIAGVSLGAI